ncbi:hypothetical protein [Roseomonas populi]|uniref:Uncharacterized protein n=1 Tax=Roseomonas populi TaxID=3121582 RepID=A0ABT1X3T7_9PROT|nr:hypothetical protein [Roseomonas pecuniae]MCR0982775.1 hypothetical protein [Roseomonas pecuniae]
MAGARALLRETDRAWATLDPAAAALDHGVGIFTEMADPPTGEYLGSLPQGLAHLAHIMALNVLEGQRGC